MGGVKFGRRMGGLGNWSDEVSVNWEDGEGLLSIYSNISQPLPIKLTLSSGGGWYLGVGRRNRSE